MTGDQIIAKYAALVSVIDTLENLTAKNLPYLNGQLILVDAGDGRTGIKRGDWKWEEQAYDAATRFNDLPWIIAPSEAGTNRVMVFTITNANADQYAFAGGVITLTDNRFKGKENFPVYCTQYGGEFRKSQLSFDTVAGTVTITGVDALADDEHISVILPTGISADPDYVSLNARMTRLESFMAPILKGGIVLPWYRPLEDIPEGWQECVDFRGKTFVGITAAQAIFNTIGKTGGSINATIAAANLPTGLKIKIANSNDQAPGYGLVLSGAFGGRVLVDGDGGSVQYSFDGAANTPLSIVNPFVVGCYIEPTEELLALYPF